MWLVAVFLLALTARLAAGEPARSLRHAESVEDAARTADSDADADADAHTDASPDADTGADAHANTNADADANTDADADSDAETDRDTDTDTEADAGADAELDAFDDLVRSLSAQDLTELGDSLEGLDAIDVEDLLVDDDSSTATATSMTGALGDATRRRAGSRFGRVDLSLGWRHRTTVRDAIDARNELWLVAAWRL